MPKYEVEKFEDWQEMADDVRRLSKKDPEKAKALLEAQEKYEDRLQKEGREEKSTELFIKALDDTLEEVDK